MAQTTRTFRIFVSSTFSDLKEERNALQREVFPKLRDLCVRHGCRFQAIDLRWGVREEAALDQQTMRICLDEVHRSQVASPRPNFILLLGDRYGWRPLPAEIPDDEFREIEVRLTDTRERELLAEWYKRDENAVPPVYCLQPREGEYIDFSTWESRVERPLRVALLKAIRGMALSDESLPKYEASATAQEIEAGALKVPDAIDHVFGFFRTIRDLPGDDRARDFIDLDENGQLDAEAKGLLDALKTRLRSTLPGNIKEYEARWTGDGITTDHLDHLCAEVMDTLQRVIAAEIERLEQVDALTREIEDHERFESDRARLFVGRAEMLKAIKRYIQGKDNHPLAVIGDSGSGKSALMARASQLARVDGRLYLIARYIGATAASSDGRSLLESLCRQITRDYGGDEATIPSDYRELVQEFPKRLALAKPDRPLVLFVDALDQLSDADHARSLTWLPAELPAHVRLIVSSLPGECATALRRKLPESSVLPLEAMREDEGDELLRAWLKEAGRTLQGDETSYRDSDGSVSQFGLVMERFRDCPLPLYLKLAFEEARRWKSYHRAVELSPDIPGVIHDLFQRLSSDANHGQVVVAKSLGYLAASKNGLSEDEMLDVMSLDGEVLKDFEERARHVPPERRLPVVVWSRLFFDLEPYLTERSADGTLLLSFYHRQLREVVEADYLSGDVAQVMHKALAAYFWEQPLFDEQSKSPNIRKLSELPFQQTLGEEWEPLYATLTDFDFLEAKCTHVAVTTTGTGESARTVYGGVYELQEDYRRALERFPE